MTQGSVVDQQVWEREYREHRTMALAMLARDFPSLPDHDEIYHEALTQALELRAEGHDVENLGGLLRAIVWRHACDLTRVICPDAVDPGSGVFQYERDPELLPEEQAELRIESAVARQIVDSLDERQAAAIKLRFEQQLDRKTIGRTLGVTQKRLDKIFNTTFRHVEEVMSELDESSEWRRRQRSLLFACEAGIASARQRRIARRMVEEDPSCRATLSEIRRTLEGMAAIIPAPVLVSSSSAGDGARFRFAFAERMGAARDQLADWVGRALRHSSVAEQASAGGAATAASGLAIKTALVCVAVTGSAVVCVTSGVLDTTPKKPKHHRPAARHHRQNASRPPDRAAPIKVAQARAPVRRTPVHRRVTKQSSPKTEVQHVSSPPAPSPAPQGSTEFGPGSIGSSSAPSQPAAAPVDGGGEFTP